MFWKIFYQLCATKEKSPNAVAKELKLSSGSITSWKNGKVPHHQTLIKIANYFDVTIDYLLGKTEEKKSSVLNEGLTEQEQALLNYFRSTSEQGKMKIIQNVMNICDEIEKKDTDSNTKHSS